MSEVRMVSVKVPDEIFSELALRIPEGDRSDFIREAIVEKLQKTPKANQILALENRMSKIEDELCNIRKTLADLELLTFGHQKVNPHNYCIDDLDHKIVDYLVHYNGATTTELANCLNNNRWLVLSRLRKIQKASRKNLGKPIVDYYGGKKSGKKKAWWVNEELIWEE